MKVVIETLQKTVALIATPEAISVEQINTRMCIIKALSTNTGLVSVGDSGNQDYPLSPGETVDLSNIKSASGGVEEIDLSKIFIKTATNANKVAVIYAKKP